ncbi:MAG: hypothetical protein MJZ66_03875 [Bacteroidales bacterium]|nr:hypothetical protein [Bacteroidales bacterium]
MKKFFTTFVMKAVMLIVAVSATAMGAKAQQTDSTFVTANLESFTPYFDKISPMFESFLDENVIRQERKTKSFWEVSCKLTMTQAQFAELKAKMDEWKCQTILQNEMIVYVNKEKAVKIESNRDLQASIDDRNAILDTLKDARERARLKSDNADGYATIRSNNKKIADLEEQIGTVSLSVVLKREMTTPKNGRRVKFVNMPGFEYSYLNIENPKAGLSAESYTGYNIKYVFTQGKSHVTVGVFKANDFVKTDSSTYSDIFNFSYGQDFYSRHMGRGGRKFLNVYSGYNVGFMAYTSEEKTLKNLYISPSVGCEIFKNNFMLWDFKVNYVLPFSNNFNLRGLQFATSLNFSL